jgi:subtilisin family serine protease
VTESIRTIEAEGGAPEVPGRHLATWGLHSTRVDTSTYSGAGVRICVLDSGIELDHPDIRVTLARSFTTIADVRDRIGHGTHCAGTIAGARVPSRGERYGIACDARLFVGKVFDTAEDLDGSADARLIRGIEWAVEQRCDIVSMSFGVAPDVAFSQAFERVARNAVDEGTLLIASAGNDSQRLQDPPLRQPVSHPANCPSILAVGAIDEDLDVVISSNAGLHSHGGAIDLVAPGANIHSAWTAPAFYARRHGTSMAVPFVAGIAALWAEATGLRGRALSRVLLENTRPLALPVEDVGRGLVQAP